MARHSASFSSSRSCCHLMMSRPSCAEEEHGRECVSGTCNAGATREPYIDPGRADRRTALEQLVLAVSARLDERLVVLFDIETAIRRILVCIPHRCEEAQIRDEVLVVVTRTAGALICGLCQCLTSRRKRSGAHIRCTGSNRGRRGTPARCGRPRCYVPQADQRGALQAGGRRTTPPSRPCSSGPAGCSRPWSSPCRSPAGSLGCQRFRRTSTRDDAPGRNPRRAGSRTAPSSCRAW